jgi:bifunctional DNase/RNase
VELHKVKIKRIIGPTPSGAAVLLGNEQKTFVVFVGFYEAAALIREINRETPARPLTHELLQNVFLGFDVEVKQVIISTIIDNTFCATLILQQQLRGETGEWVGRRNEVRIDARPSDCLVLALKNKLDILVTEEVFQQVQDVSQMTAEVEGSLVGMALGELEFDLRGTEAGSEARGQEEEEDDDGEGDEEEPGSPEDLDDGEEEDEDNFGKGFGGYKP